MTTPSTADADNAPRPPPARRSADGGRVLIVEDSRAIATVLASRIGVLDGIACDHADSHAAAQALLAADPARYFVAVIGLAEPGASSADVIELLEAHGLPVIVLTDSLDQAHRDRMFERGVADYVVKDSVVGIEYVARLVSRLAHSHEAKVLVVDDARAFRDYLTALLEQHGYATVTAGDGEAGLAALKADPDINLVIADYNMPRMDGLTMVSEMRRLRSHDELAIIAVSDSQKPGLLADFLRGGASDYLRKPFVIEEFYCRVDQNIDMLRSVRRAREMASRDFLTGLHNRRYFFEQAERLHRRALAGELRMMVAMIDADHFKRINDRFGHQVGDDALLAIADALRDVAGQCGLVARFGGEEFVIAHTITRPDEARRCLERMRQRIADIDLRHEGEAVPLTVSIGATHKHGLTLDDMLQRADLAVYEAKSRGRNRVVID
jgi:diguanylate cyclase (GGDEF)-like protein